MKESNNSAYGTSGCFVLFVVFLILKLTKVINWSWWWVTSPLWIGFLLAIIALIIGVVVYYFKYR